MAVTKKYKRKVNNTLEEIFIGADAANIDVRIDENTTENLQTILNNLMQNGGGGGSTPSGPGYIEWNEGIDQSE